MGGFLHTVLRMLNGRIVSRWLILFIDIVVVWVSYVLANIIRFNFEFANLEWSLLLTDSAMVVLVSTSFFLLFKSYASIIRHTSIHDTVKVFQAMTASGLFLVLLSNLGTLSLSTKTFSIPLSIILIFYLNSLFALIFLRILIKLVYHNIYHHKNTESVNVLIYGAGELGMITKNTLTSNAAVRYKVIGFVDHNPGKIGKTIEGIHVYKPEDITREFLALRSVGEVIFSIQNIGPDKKREIIDQLLTLDVVVKAVPPVENWIHGQLKVRQIEKIRIEEGHINKMEFNADADRDYSTGTMVLNYDDLKLSFLKNDAKSGHEDLGLLSSLANVVIRSFNPAKNSNNSAEPAEIFFERDKNKSIFNYMAKSMISGIKSTVIPGFNMTEEKYKRQQEREDKKDARQERREERRNKRRNK